MIWFWSHPLIHEPYFWLGQGRNFFFKFMSELSFLFGSLQQLIQHRKLISFYVGKGISQIWNQHKKNATCCFFPVDFNREWMWFSLSHQETNSPSGFRQKAMTCSRTPSQSLFWCHFRGRTERLHSSPCSALSLECSFWVTPVNYPRPLLADSQKAGKKAQKPRE